MTISKRLLALSMAVWILVSALPVGALAAESEADTAGTETQEWTGDVPPGTAVPSVQVTIQLTPDTTSAAGASAETTGIITGDAAESEDDPVYDYTVTDTTIQRDVEVTVTQAEVTLNQTEEDTSRLECPVQPEDYQGKHYDTHETITGFTPSDGLLNGMDPDHKTPDPKPEEPGYDLYLSGSGDATWAAAPVCMNIVYQKDPETGLALVDPETGEYIIDQEKSGLVYAGSKAGYSGMDSTPGQIVLKNENGELFYTYCIDKVTPTDSGSWYRVENLEDSNYYPDDESAEKLRAIVENGYWGTEEGTGSLAQIKQLLRDTYGPEDTVTVTDASGGEHTYQVADLIDQLKEHEALAATQAAIWSYSNGSLATMDGQDGVMVVGVQSAKKYFNGKNQDSPLNQYGPAYDLESDAVLKALYDCLMGLDGVPATDESVTTVITENTAVSDMSLVVHDKVAGHEDNLDGSDSNDVYNTDLTFTLAFIPDPASDDLLVFLTDASGNTITDKDGNPMVRRLAGENSEGREAQSIAPDENGVYTLTGLQLSENADFVFDLRLEGTQYLQEGIYIYTAHGGREESQTLVGLAEGDRSVDVSVGMTIRFNVDETQHVVATRKWRTEPEPVTNPPAENQDPPPVWNLPPAENLANDTVVIPDEPVPLAEAAVTGDSTGFWMAGFLVTALAIALLNLPGRKHRAF